jgi:hypothetical protein
MDSLHEYRMNLVGHRNICIVDANQHVENLQ